MNESELCLLSAASRDLRDRRGFNWETGMGVVPVLPFTYWSQEPTYHVSTLCDHNLQDWDRKRSLGSYWCQAIRNPIKVPLSRQRRRRRRKVIRNPIEACGGRVSTHCQADRPVVGVWEPPRGHTRLPPSCNTCTLQACNSVTLDCPHLVTPPPNNVQSYDTSIHTIHRALQSCITDENCTTPLSCYTTSLPSWNTESKAPAPLLCKKQPKCQS